MAQVNHKQIYRNGPFGGVVNTTLCGRISNATNDYNVEDIVTCKLCTKIIGDKKHWRHKNIIKEGGVK